MQDMDRRWKGVVEETRKNWHWVVIGFLIELSDTEQEEGNDHLLYFEILRFHSLGLFAMTAWSDLRCQLSQVGWPIFVGLCSRKNYISLMFRIERNG